eukprot:TRINITY_DN18836_c0_g1_i1.p1 TRINITY_DN18836_c0_g1~~TRINITY_DN18836_c0_g1_i1.p1  ORF type:complete len:293 (+),score=41.62 TRINITY_DN18836_c0_g1_i1:85-879(+)
MAAFHWSRTLSVVVLFGQVFASRILTPSRGKDARFRSGTCVFIEGMGAARIEKDCKKARPDEKCEKKTCSQFQRKALECDYLVRFSECLEQHFTFEHVLASQVGRVLSARELKSKKTCEMKPLPESLDADVDEDDAPAPVPENATDAQPKVAASAKAQPKADLPTSGGSSETVGSSEDEDEDYSPSVVSIYSRHVFSPQVSSDSSPEGSDKMAAIGKGNASSVMHRKRRWELGLRKSMATSTTVPIPFIVATSSLLCALSVGAQ